METGEATGIKNELEPKEDEMSGGCKRFAKEEAARLLYTSRGVEKNWVKKGKGKPFQVDCSGGIPVCWIDTRGPANG